MNPRTFAIVILVPFSVLTVWSVIADGTGGFPAAITHNYTSLQIFFDLVIAMIFWCAWVLKDARKHGRNGWPWVIAGLIFGAFSPLIYMVVHQRWPASVATSGAQETAEAGQRRAFGVVSILFLGALTAAALLVDGTDITATISNSWSNVQIWVDLVIMILIWIVWMVNDARQAGRNPWGWVVLALLIGSFSPLIYLLLYGRWPASHPRLA